MLSFKIYGMWQQANKQTTIYTHNRTTVLLFWGLLRLAPIKRTIWNVHMQILNISWTFTGAGIEFNMHPSSTLFTVDTVLHINFYQALYCKKTGVEAWKKKRVCSHRAIVCTLATLEVIGVKGHTCPINGRSLTGTASAKLIWTVMMPGGWYHFR